MSTQWLETFNQRKMIWTESLDEWWKKRTIMMLITTMMKIIMKTNTWWRVRRYKRRTTFVCFFRFNIDGRVQSAQQTDDSKSKETFTSLVNWASRYLKCSASLGFVPSMTQSWSSTLLLTDTRVPPCVMSSAQSPDRCCLIPDSLRPSCSHPQSTPQTALGSEKDWKSGTACPREKGRARQAYRLSFLICVTSPVEVGEVGVQV